MMIRIGLSIMLVFAAAFPAEAAMRMGVNTHFEQGWPLSAFDEVRESGAEGIREVVQWGKVERQPGTYAFTNKNSGFMNHACARSVPVLVMVPPRNTLYENGMVPASDTGRKALAGFIGALIARFPCIVGVEIGNEINTKSPYWPPPSQKFPLYVALLKEIRHVLDERKSRVALVGGSSITVDVPFHERMFAAGELKFIDAVAIHPYIGNPDRLPEALERLSQAMQRYGGIKPIWSTEFGFYYKTPDAAPPHALKVMTIMSAAHVDRAYWYALRDEPWFPNMGLFAGTTPKPALDTFRLAHERLLPAGDARRIETGDALTFIYRFGRDGPYVMWGNGRRVTLPPGAQVYDARGRKIQPPETLEAAPVIVESPSGYKIR